MLEFDELAKLLDRRYTDGYLDRDLALREFGFEHEPELRRFMDSGRSLTELAEAARISIPVAYYVGYIREGMGAAIYQNKGFL